jgi:predicted TIM-barrel fold metal-dependent hydrolase
MILFSKSRCAALTIASSPTPAPRRRTGSSGSAILPLRDIEASLTEMRWAKEQGAVGIFFRGMEGNLTLDNPYFSPVYGLAEELDLTVCIHTGSGSRLPDATVRCRAQSHLCP